MSNLLFLDESNGNGFYATSKPSSPAKLSASPINVKNINSKSTNATTAAASSSSSPQPPQAGNFAKATNNKIDNLMANNAAAAAAAAAAVVAATLSTSVSNEDLSLSEYTDADESISAPTEFLAEFLSAVMLKDYKKALKYCKLILQYEPNNATAKEFYPLILEKLHGAAASSDSDENYNKSSSPELPLELQSIYLTARDSDEPSDEQQQQLHLQQQHQQHHNASLDNVGDDDSDDGIAPVGIQISDSSGSGLSGGDVGSGVESLGSVSMEEEDDEDDDGGIVDHIDNEEDEDEEDEDILSSSGDDDLPNDIAHLGLNNASAGLDNTSQSSPNSSSGTDGEGRSRSDNTTHSYSSLLLEEEDDMLPTNLPFLRDKDAHELDVSNGNNITSASCSDSESPTEPLTQRLAAILLSKCGVSSNDDNF